MDRKPETGPVENLPEGRNLSTEYQPKGSARNPSDTLDKPETHPMDRPREPGVEDVNSGKTPGSAAP